MPRLYYLLNCAQQRESSADNLKGQQRLSEALIFSSIKLRVSTPIRRYRWNDQVAEMMRGSSRCDFLVHFLSFLVVHWTTVGCRGEEFEGALVLLTG